MRYIFHAITYFAVLIYTEEEINDLETVVSMLSCKALERSNNLHIWNLVFLRIRKRSLLYGLDRDKNPEMEKSIHELKAEFV